MKYIEKYNEFVKINEAFENVDTSNFDKVLIKNKSRILQSVNNHNYKQTLELLNTIFKNKILQSEHATTKDIDNIIARIQQQIDRINKKILRYPKIKIYLKDEIAEQKLYIQYTKNKNRKYVNLHFVSYNEHYNLKEKGIFSKFFDWLKKTIWPSDKDYNIHYNEYKKEANKEKIKTYDFGLEYTDNLFNNDITFIFRENFLSKLNAENFEQFTNLLKISYRHELTYLRDFSKSAQEVIFNDFGIAPYLEQSTEILAYAETIVEEFRLNKFTDKEIENIIIEPHKNEIKVKVSDPLWTYYNLYFNTNKYVYYRIVSECLDIINKEYKEYK